MKILLLSLILILISCSKTQQKTPERMPPVNSDTNTTTQTDTLPVVQKNVGPNLKDMDSLLAHAETTQVDEVFQSKWDRQHAILDSINMWYPKLREDYGRPVALEQLAIKLEKLDGVISASADTANFLVSWEDLSGEVLMYIDKPKGLL